MDLRKQPSPQGFKGADGLRSSVNALPEIQTNRFSILDRRCCLGMQQRGNGKPEHW